GKKGRRPAADINRVKAFERNQRGFAESHFLYEGLHKFRNPIRAGNGVKAAIAAFAFTERDVKIKTGLIHMH
ncbi:MAG TPA: hypothetical protein PLZ33_05725, partial [Smithellaceae bacterium]|nr:hypothetical protein [Smithellaceae bacterium]HQN67214.1 hypothetical protein [Smithellaceae bacterium]HQP06462.1 hypothetical protein [Smithellaceae bacterium]